MNDWELLQAYVRQRSEQAFELLVNRYLALVYATALRQTGDPHLAQEATQATFLVLARKAGRLSQQTILAGWLFRTTRFVALRSVRKEARRQVREQQAVAAALAMPPPNTLAAGSWDEVEPLLNEAIERLASREREVVLLRFGQGKTLRDVSLALGISEAAARKRANRAVEKMRAFLARHGFKGSAAMLAAGLTANAQKTVPADLAGTVVATVASASRGLPGPLLLKLVELASRYWFWTQVRRSAAIGLLPALVLLLGVAGWQQFRSTPLSTDVSAANTATSTTMPVATTTQGMATTQRTNRGILRLQLVDSTSGLPLAGADLSIAYWRSDPPEKLESTSDAAGRCDVPVPADAFQTLRAWIFAAGHVPKVIDWHDYERFAPVEDYVVRLDRGRRIGGLIIDEQGQPVAGAKVWVRTPGIDSGQRENVGYLPRHAFAMTGSDGRWHYDEAHSLDPVLSLFVTHPELARSSTGIPVEGTEATNGVFTLYRGIRISGVVLTANDVPIIDAEVEEITRDGSPPESTRTDFDGRFVFPNLNPDAVKLEVSARGYESTQRRLPVASNATEARFVLTEAAPASSPAGPRNNPPRVRLVGRVLDAVTEQPIDAFEVILHQQRGTLPNFIGSARQGRFDWRYPVMFFSEYAVEVRAAGYAPEISPKRTVKEEGDMLFRLTKTQEVAGQVQTPEGQPAGGAEVFLGGPKLGPWMVSSPRRGYFLNTNAREQQTKTDSRGAFRFRPLLKADRVVISHPSGCAVVALPELTNGPVRLQAWGRVEGVLRVGKKMMGNLTVGIEDTASPTNWTVPCSMNATTDEQERFVFERVPPGPHRLFRVLNLHQGLSGPIGLSHHTNVLVAPGEITRITLGGTGRKVVGRVVTEPSNVRVVWAQQLQRLVQVRNEPAPNPDQFPDMTAYHQAWRAHDAAQNQSYFEIAADGTFVIDDVGPGAFQLEIKAVAPRPEPLDPERFEKPETILGSIKKTVTIPETTTDGNAAVFDLGTVLIPLKNGHE